MSFTRTELRLLAILNKRSATDTICWVLFFLLTLGFCGIKNETFITPENLYTELLQDSLVYTSIMMIPVYFNLLVLKRYLLDSSFGVFFRFSTYLVSTLLVAILIAYLIDYIDQLFPDFFKNKEKWRINILVIFGVQLIATGLLNLRELYQRNRILDKQNKFLKVIQAKDQALEAFKLSVSQNHIKIGNKTTWKLLPYKDILFIEGQGNDIHLYKDTDQLEVFKNTTIKDFNNLLPEHLFIQIHKSYIVNKTKVIGRASNKFFLQGKEIEIPIGRTYKHRIDTDSYLQFIAPFDK